MYVSRIKRGYSLGMNWWLIKAVKTDMWNVTIQGVIVEYAERGIDNASLNEREGNKV